MLWVCSVCYGDIPRVGADPCVCPFYVGEGQVWARQLHSAKRCGQGTGNTVLCRLGGKFGAW